MQGISGMEARLRYGRPAAPARTPDGRTSPDEPVASGQRADTITNAATHAWSGGSRRPSCPSPCSYPLLSTAPAPSCSHDWRAVMARRPRRSTAALYRVGPAKGVRVVVDDGRELIDAGGRRQVCSDTRSLRVPPPRRPALSCAAHRCGLAGTSPATTMGRAMDRVSNDVVSPAHRGTRDRPATCPGSSGSPSPRSP